MENNFNIPEALFNLAEEVPSSSLSPLKSTITPQIEEVVHEISKLLSFKDLNDFNQGFCYYKTDVTSEENFLKNLISLLIDHINKKVRSSQIEENKKEEIISSTSQMFRNVEQIILSNYKLIRLFNNDKNLLEIKSISIIILGYALGTLKRIDNTQIQK